jgi:hypothetical protein
MGFTMANETIALDQLLAASEQLSHSDQLRLIGLLSERLRRELMEGEEPVDILSLAGVGAELWQQVDVADYIEQERSTWDD